MIKKTRKWRLEDATDEEIKVWRKIFMESKKVDLAEAKWVTLTVSIPDPSHTKHNPFAIVTLKFNRKNRIHLFARDYGAFRLLLENVAEGLDYFNHEGTYGKIIEAKFAEAWDIRNRDIGVIDNKSSASSQ